MSIRNIIIVSLITFFLTACGGGGSNSDSSSASTQSGNPEIAGNYLFRGQGRASGENFNASFTANRFSFDTEDRDSGSFVFASPKKIVLSLSSGEKVNADLEVDSNNKVSKITTRAPDGTTFIGTRR
ncbi:MAG: hypothetical protein ACRBHB_09725 [Arenicella sp.]